MKSICHFVRAAWHCFSQSQQKTNISRRCRSVFARRQAMFQVRIRY